MHDWSDVNAIKLLKRLREAAVPGKTKLLLVETVLNYACRDLPAGVEEISGIEKLVPPIPKELLTNLGRGGGWASLLDLQCVARI
jgi:hypothetical protein